MRTASIATLVSQGRKFSTTDKDHDDWNWDGNRNCAAYFGTGWWLNACSTSNINMDGLGWWGCIPAPVGDVILGRMMIKLA